jgi:hydantoinase/carbamoylase family amidase
MTSPGERLMDRLAAFARHSDEPGKLTRLFLSPSHRAAVDELTRWMREAGLSVSTDALGTLCGRYEGKSPNAPALLIGSHIDTVRDAGRYDGALGVLAGLVAVEELAHAGERFPFAIEIVAFGDEEGVRFPVALSSSRALAGTFDATTLDAKDADGVSMRQALKQFGCDPGRVATIARARDGIAAYIEAHIEQGPVLEAEDLPVGVVTAINAVKRFTVKITGEAGHAGTVPMDMRRDALAAAADMLLAIERNAASMASVVATAGRIVAAPGAVNVIPGSVTFTLDLRAPSNTTRDAALAAMTNAMRGIAQQRGVALEIALNHEGSATACSPAVIEGLSTAIARQGIKVRQLPSGAGHDAMAMAALCPIGMIFVRCKGGISHNPAEEIATEDADVCVRVLIDYVRNFDMSAVRSA